MNGTERTFDRVNAVVAFGVLLIVAVVYSMTKAPTLSLWDCGEFIAACATLGIPHPPGSPLYVIIGRIFSLLLLSDDIGARINILSVLASSFTALFGYLVTVRVLRGCFFGENSVINRIIIYGGGFAGSLTLAFSLTNWNNSVEAEVYGLSMMMLLAVVWLGLIYRGNMGTKFGGRVMLLMVFIAIAGISVHMTTLMALPAAGLLFLLKKSTPKQLWYVVGAFLLFELYLVFAMSSRPGEIPYYIPVAIVFVFYLFYIFSYEKMPAMYLVVAGGFLLSVLPLAGSVIVAVKGNTTGNVALLTTVGKFCLVVLIVAAFFGVYRYFRLPDSDERRQHYLITSLFILVAGLMSLIAVINFHGYTLFLIATAVLCLAFAFVLRRYLNWPVLIAIICICLIILGVKEFALGLIAGAILIPLVGIIFKLSGWKNALLILLVAVIGYSIHLYIPIRSARQPVLNENNPSESLAATIGYIERKQYGSQSMVERMFKRRAEWGNQFGNFERMGFWYFFQQQYGMSGIRFVPVFILGLFGIWEVLRRRSEYGTPLLILLMLASVGLILYMNFADGTRIDPVTGGDYLEVRDRDYFFTVAYIIFGLAIGMGLAAVVQFVKESARKSSSSVKKWIAYASMVVFLFPAYTLAQNYYFANRSGDYVAYDYAWNLLLSAEKDAVLVTAGDNDTFPLWCLQEAYNIRKDVAVVNLSLANARWYIKQLKNTLGIQLRWSDSDIDSLFVFRDQNGHIHRLQDQVVAEIINSSWYTRLINFAVTVPPDGRTFMGRGIDSLLVLNGLVRRLETGRVTGNVDVEKTIEILTEPGKMRYRSLTDPAVFKTEAALRLTRNYLQIFIEVADTLVAADDYERAEWLMKKGAELVPHASESINYLAALYAEQGKTDAILELIENPGSADKRWLRTILGRTHRALGDRQQAEQIFQTVLKDDPSYRYAMEELVRLYFDSRQLGPMRQVLQTWVSHNPGDREIVDLLKNIDEQLKNLNAPGDSSS